MSNKILHYNLDNIKSLGANINIIYGERSNGKSYQVKHKQAVLKYLNGTDVYYDNYKKPGDIVKSCIEKGTRFILLRRLKDEIGSDNIEPYFADIDITSYTDGEYNMITMYNKKLYLSKYDNESGKAKRYNCIGYVRALSTEQNSAGASFLDVTDIIFEEFMSRSVYLAHEPDKLMNFYSTVDRKRGTTKLWLVGNSITRVCPYINEWGLDEIFRNLKQGEIVCKWIPTGEVDEENYPIKVKIAVEYCKSTGRTSFAIGKHKDMLNKGTWQTDPQPHLPKSRNLYKRLYRIMFIYKSFKFIAEYLLDPDTGDTCWFIYPTHDDPSIYGKIIVFSDIIKTSPYWQRDIYLPSLRNKKLVDLLKTFKENKIFYCSDLCGTDFKQVIDFEIKK